jgi:hypothetical protein
MAPELLIKELRRKETTEPVELDDVEVMRTTEPAEAMLLAKVVLVTTNEGLVVWTLARTIPFGALHPRITLSVIWTILQSSWIAPAAEASVASLSMNELPVKVAVVAEGTFAVYAIKTGEPPTLPWKMLRLIVTLVPERTMIAVAVADAMAYTN